MWNLSQRHLGNCLVASRHRTKVTVKRVQPEVDADVQNCSWLKRSSVMWVFLQVLVWNRNVRLTAVWVQTKWNIQDSIQTIELFQSELTLMFPSVFLFCCIPVFKMITYGLAVVMNHGKTCDHLCFFFLLQACLTIGIQSNLQILIVILVIIYSEFLLLRLNTSWCLGQRTFGLSDPNYHLEHSTGP